MVKIKILDIASFSRTLTVYWKNKSKQIITNTKYFQIMEIM